MKYLCSLPVRIARKLRNRLSPALLRASTTTHNAAASIRQSVCQSLHFHHSSASTGTDKLKHHPKPAALGTKAMLGNVKASVATGMQAARGEGVKLRHQMSTIYQNWEQGIFHNNHNNTSRLN